MLWKPLKINDTCHAFRIVKNFELFDDEDQQNRTLMLTFWLSDFRVIYKEQIPLRELLDRAKQENSIVEYESGIVLDTIFNGHSTQLQLVVDHDDKSVFRLKCKYYVSQLPFHFYWKLERQSQDVFYEEITKPLFGSLLDAQAQCKHLLDVVHAKDVEIEQYQLDGAELTRKHLATKPFVRQAFEKSTHSEPIGSLVQVASGADTVGLGVQSTWLPADQQSVRSDVESTLFSPNKRSASNSPVKPIKRSAKDILARSKIQAAPDASVMYGDEEDEDSCQDTTSVQTSPVATVAANNSTNVRKVRTKLNL